MLTLLNNASIRIWSLISEFGINKAASIGNVIFNGKKPLAKYPCESIFPSSGRTAGDVELGLANHLHQKKKLYESAQYADSISLYTPPISRPSSPSKAMRSGNSMFTIFLEHFQHCWMDVLSIHLIAFCCWLCLEYFSQEVHPILLSSEKDIAKKVTVEIQIVVAYLSSR